jgi:hypothetical protein
MKSKSIALVSTLALICINSHAHNRPWVIDPKDHYAQKASQWKEFFNDYGLKTAVGMLAGTACGTGCAFFEKKFFPKQTLLQYGISWFVFWLVKSALMSKITNEMKDHGIEDKNRIVGISSLLSAWASYILFKLKPNWLP